MAEAFTNADIQSLAQKLMQFNQTLTPGEQTVLATVVLRGAVGSGDVEGYSVTGPQGGQNVGAFGVQEGGDPFSPISNIFYPQTRPGRDRIEDRH